MKIYIAAPLFNEGERAFNEKVDDILTRISRIPMKPGFSMASEKR